MEPTGNGDNGDNGDNGERDDRGRFTQGNSGGPGNPHSLQVSRLRSALLNAVTEDDMREIIEALVAKAKEGSIAAARVLFNRTIGRPLEPDIIERIERLEARHEP